MSGSQVRKTSKSDHIRSAHHHLRFFETEGIAILTMLMSQYRVEVKEDPKYAGETFEQRKHRLLDCRFTLSTTYVLIIVSSQTLG